MASAWATSGNWGSVRRNSQANAYQPSTPDPVTKGFIIRSDDKKDIRFEADFGDGSPTVTDGYSGWAVISRPKNIGLTEWAGRNPIAVEIPFMLDYWPDGMDDDDDTPGLRCESMIDKLEQLCGVGSGDHPPICWVQGNGVIPHDYTISPTLRWVIENLTWNRDIELRAHTGRRLRAGGTILIRQFKDGSVLTRVGSQKKKTTTRPQIYHVKAGDTLSKIAAKVYKDASKWRVIADANNIRDRRHLKVNQALRIP